MRCERRRGRMEEWEVKAEMKQNWRMFKYGFRSF